MNKLLQRVKQVNLTQIDEYAFVKRFSGCIILTHDNKILLQERPEDWRSFPGMVTTFGGKCEGSETSAEGLIRELHEELGAIVKPEDLIDLGALTEEVTHHTELAYLFFWHDKHNTITGCYECSPLYFTDIPSALKHPKLTDDVVWALCECKQNNLL